jgi:hypothetical protein
VKFTRTYALAALALAGIAAIVVAAKHASVAVGYIQINTVPLAPLTQTSLYLDTEKLDPVRQGSALLKERVGTLKLQASSYGAMTPLCDIEVRSGRITTVTISVLDRPPRCQCRFGGNDKNRACVS